jgi:hypothetical protein
MVIVGTRKMFPNIAQEMTLEKGNFIRAGRKCGVARVSVSDFRSALAICGTLWYSYLGEITK